MRNVIRIVSLLLVTILLGLVPTEVVWAQAITYTFKKIANTDDDSGLSGPYCVGINNLGTVIVTFAPAGSNYFQLWRRADGEAFTQVAPVAGNVCASINDLGQTAYVTYEPTAPDSQVLVRNSNGTITTLARSDLSPFLSSGTTYLPSLNNSGNAVFQGGTGGDSIFIAPAGTTVFDHSMDPLLFATTASMNDSGTVAFLAIRPDSSVPSGSRVGIYRGSLTPLVEDGGPIIEAVGLNRSVINNSGTVAFIGRISGTANASILTTDDGVNFTTVGTLLESTGRISINNHGTVAYRGPGEAVYASSNRVIGAGDLLDGSTVQFALVWEESINDDGQVAFWALLADGRAGVYRADPVDNSIDTQGPITLNSTATPKLVPFGTGFILTATVTDTTTGGSTIASAEYSIDGGPYLPMNAVDGAFDQVTENVTTNVAPPTAPGVYNICIRGTDSQNNVGVPECFMVPVYDPSAGFVTGGGWIISQAGAYLADATLTGKANFGFVSKYLKGKSIPTGETEFQFHVAGFKFNSTVYDWLVVTGAKAQYQGRGTVNGTGLYQFVLTAKDGDLAAPVEPDKFRIKITDINPLSPNYGKVVYDNQRGQSTDLNTAEPQAIAGGGIVIHKAK